MSAGSRWHRVRWLILALVTGTSLAHAEDYFDRYGLTPKSASVDVGIQPLGYPSGVISAVMRRDRTLQKELLAIGRPLKTHAFRRGADMIGLLSDQRLEVGLLGDMPTLTLASTGRIWIAGLVKQSSTAIIARGEGQVKNLAGRKIGYVPVSSAHHTLLQGLASAGLNESHVTLVAMGVDDMPAALERGDIDAFAAWEPAPTLALQTNQRNNVVFRGRTADYLVIEREFARRDPVAATQIVTALARAIEWMRRSQGNVEKAARWALADHASFAGKTPGLAVDRVVAITRREILSVPSAPVIVPASGREVPLKSEFDFLQRLGKLPEQANWEHVSKSFGNDTLARVMMDPQRHQLSLFDYDD